MALFLCDANATRAIAQPNAPALKLVPHQIKLANGKTFSLNLPQDFGISVAAEGLKRVRFMARSPDDRIFVTDMYNLADNKKGAVYILDEFNPATASFKKVTPYLTGLRNPNSIAFYRDQNGVDWFYLALTDHLLRIKYAPGDLAPSAKPEVLATFPDYGLSYKYGGWHLTRTIAIGDNGKIYVSVGSSCNACEEKEDVRASVLEMDPDGGNQKHFARGLRNAVGLRWVERSTLRHEHGLRSSWRSQTRRHHVCAETGNELRLAVLLPIRRRQAAGHQVQPRRQKDELPRCSAGVRSFRRAQFAVRI